MDKECIIFADNEIEKPKFHHHINYKNPTVADIDYILISNKIFFGEKNYKYLIGYMYDDYKIKSLHIVLLKTSAYVKSCDSKTTWLIFQLKMMT